MDVVVNPIGPPDTEWTLYDRLGRHLGMIRRTAWSDTPFTILPERGSRLDGMAVLHPSLEAALTAIEQRLGGTCELVGGSEP
ncbi:hypothetical protein [Methylobacterium oxalidis]|uniref:Uncharacterized protein n=1 Tax=Methylobacterium oxalidis TaxID=944322 RepID=A0A512JBL5_9HYPH|nr:hypothetical protein [Methylobacterium oxalidis]GEP07291.1 hypothetical protein MOX02_53290 [Methylobacterium oxalidis]GJE31426.1 hypothetical protein LDDCCGHA_1604 [Methylobacterium oxalidis]GLS65135.1 hypothetical protein GCM10007888_35170 [Methylobacterium oxalidis]